MKKPPLRDSSLVNLYSCFSKHLNELRCLNIEEEINFCKQSFKLLESSIFLILIIIINISLKPVSLIDVHTIKTPKRRFVMESEILQGASENKRICLFFKKPYCGHFSQ